MMHLNRPKSRQIGFESMPFKGKSKKNDIFQFLSSLNMRINCVNRT